MKTLLIVASGLEGGLVKQTAEDAGWKTIHVETYTDALRMGAISEMPDAIFAYWTVPLAHEEEFEREKELAGISMRETTRLSFEVLFPGGYQGRLMQLLLPNQNGQVLAEIQPDALVARTGKFDAGTIKAFLASVA